eukprot:Skav229257  [mRNA]  locus=scaffold2418:103682:119506:- [translate_table: standard]
MSVAKRVSEEYGCPDTLIKYMTDGMLLREILSDDQAASLEADHLHRCSLWTAEGRSEASSLRLSACQHCLIGIQIDMSSSFAANLPRKRKELKLIVTSASASMQNTDLKRLTTDLCKSVKMATVAFKISTRQQCSAKLPSCEATLDAEKFSSYFFNSHIFTIPGRILEFWTVIPCVPLLWKCLQDLPSGNPLLEGHAPAPKNSQYSSHPEPEAVQPWKQSCFQDPEQDYVEAALMTVYSALPSEMQTMIFECLAMPTGMAKAMGIQDMLSFDFMDSPTLGSLDDEGMLTDLGRKMAEFWEGLQQVKLSQKLPHLEEDVLSLGSSLCVGFPIGGDTISVTTYTQASAELLGIQIDAAINSGNSGGPAFNRCLKDLLKHGKYTGFPTLGVDTQTMERLCFFRALAVASHGRREWVNSEYIEHLQKPSKAQKFFGEKATLTVLREGRVHRLQQWVLAHELTMGYDHLENMQLIAVSDVPVLNLRHAMELTEMCDGPYLHLTLQQNQAQSTSVTMEPCVASLLGGPDITGSRSAESHSRSAGEATWWLTMVNQWLIVVNYGE